MKGGHLQKQNNMVNMGDEVGMKVNTLDMPRKASYSVKAITCLERLPKV
jgi:hypothetical protein